MTGAGELALAMISGASLALAAVGTFWAGKAELRARLAEDLLARAAARRSEAVAKGNRTRGTQDRDLVRKTTDALRRDIAARGPVQQGLGLD